MPATIQLEVVTPDGVVFKGPALAVTLPVDEGEIQVLPGHIPVLTRVLMGQLEVTLADGRRELLAVGDGFARITGDGVAILSDMAIHAADVNEIEVEAARRRAEARLQEKLTAEEYAAVNAALAQAIVKLRVKRRQSSR